MKKIYIEIGDLCKGLLIGKEGINVDQPAANQATALYLAAENGRLEIVEDLIKAGADVDIAAEDGFTPLHVAASMDRLEIVEALIEAGADVNKTTEDGFTPLHVAASMGHLGIVNKLKQSTPSKSPFLSQLFRCLKGHDTKK